jgi:hypothetical protein
MARLRARVQVRFRWTDHCREPRGCADPAAEENLTANAPLAKITFCCCGAILFLPRRRQRPPNRPEKLTMIRIISFVLSALLLASFVHADYPKPSEYPIAWELSFEHEKPKRITVQSGDDPLPKAYWYLKYTVTNNGEHEQTFLPMFELLTDDGRVIRSDKNISPKVFDEIKKTEKNKFLIPPLKVGGEMRLGEDEAKESVAIWEEPTPEMGNFSIFVTGLSGEATTIKDPNGKKIILRKTLQLNYLIRGDEFYPGEDEVNINAEAWVMR